MEVLVDYSNLSRGDRSRGPTFVIDKVIAALGYPLLHGQSRIQFRLYDGWYDNRTPTRRAQSVSAEILANFPSTRTLTDGRNSATLVVNAELAYSLKVDPSTHLWHTFRLRGVPKDLSCRDPVAVGCTVNPCMLLTTHSFFSSQVCPSPGCTMTPIDLIRRSEQKLVDTMLASDLFFMHVLRLPRAAIVSSDDDMWPPIKTVLDLGMHVIHVHTLPAHRTPAFYFHGHRPSYTQVNL